MSFFFSSRRRHTRWPRDWSSDVCSSDLLDLGPEPFRGLSGVELGFEHDRTVDQVQRGGEAEDRGHLGPARGGARSEERRVGKEWRSRREKEQRKNKRNEGQIRQQVEARE